MKFTLNIPIDRADYRDEDGEIPNASISDMELLLWDSYSDYKQFRENIASLLLEQIKEQM